MTVAELIKKLEGLSNQDLEIVLDPDEEEYIEIGDITHEKLDDSECYVMHFAYEDNG